MQKRKGYMMELKPGNTLKDGKYKIVRTLGQGSYGITYHATTRLSMAGQLGKLDVNVNVTIKEFFMSNFNSRASDGSSVEKTNSSLVRHYRDKFRKEAENLSKLNHPNIVKVLEVFDENNTTYYVMEFIDGENVDDYIKKNVRLPENESLKITTEVCSALSYMHEHMMIHLDVKPKNMMRSKEGRIYLIDFGLSKQYDDNGEPESSTTIGLGTPGYAPIEQAHYKGDGSLPATLDIYALGASLYKMLTGETPPDSSYVLNNGLPISPLKEAGVSERTIDLVQKSMAPIKKNRYQTVSDLLQAINNSSFLDEGSSVPEGEDKIDDEQTMFDANAINQRESNHNEKNNHGEKLSFFRKYWKYGSALAGVLIFFLCIYYGFGWYRSSHDEQTYVDTTFIDTTISTIKPTDLEELPSNNLEEHNMQKDDENDKHSSQSSGIIENLLSNMVYVKGGTFTMGATSEQGSDVDDDATPAHQVTLSSFSIGRYEVTQEEWEAVMGSNPSEFKGKRLPVEKVSWSDCQDFIKKLNQLTGKKYRLPTEAEWEYAARGGSKSLGYKFSGGKDIGAVAWYDDISDSKTHEVGQKKPNELGLYDMSGNVWEMCSDRYGKYSSSSQMNPTGPSTGSDRVCRGGSWFNYARRCRVSFRSYYSPDKRNSNLGLRLAL